MNFLPNWEVCIVHLKKMSEIEMYMIIEISEVAKTFKSNKALDKVSLSVCANTIFGLVGPNGAGKSTLINILTGIVKKNSGKIIILGYDIDKEPIEIKKRLGVFPEELAVFDGLTGEEYLSFVSKVYRVSKAEQKERISELLKYFDLYLDKDRLIETYSHGMKKKIAFAAAVIHRPQVLVLDEPFENIDPISRRKMKTLLESMKRNGGAVFITSHALAEVEDFCDEVAILNKGEIIFRSATKDIRSRMKNELLNESYKSLEEIFLDLTAENQDDLKSLPWI